MSKTDESKSLMPVSQIEDDKLEALDKETGNFQTTVRTNKEGTDFLLNGEPIGDDPIVGVVINFSPNWTRYHDDNKPPDKVYGDAIPDGDKWKRRCDLLMLTAKYGIIVLDLSHTGYLNFGKYQRDLKVYGKSFAEVFTKALIGKGRSKKYGQYSTVRFEIAGLVSNAGVQKVGALPQGEESPFDVDEEVQAMTIEDSQQPPDGDDVVPY